MATQTSAPDTRTRLVDAAAHLFARRGIEEVPLRDIGELAEQRNASAVQYHFGGRWELVAAILDRHRDTVQGWDPPFESMSVTAVVDGLVALLRPQLATSDGRDFLRVVHELMARYPGRWDGDPHANEGLARLVDRLVTLLDELPHDVARARAISTTQFVTFQMAERARLLDGGRPGVLLDEDTFVANVTAMSIAMLTAPLARRRQRGASRSSPRSSS